MSKICQTHVIHMSNTCRDYIKNMQKNTWHICLKYVKHNIISAWPIRWCMGASWPAALASSRTKRFAPQRKGRGALAKPGAWRVDAVHNCKYDSALLVFQLSATLLGSGRRNGKQQTQLTSWRKRMESESGRSLRGKQGTRNLETQIHEC